MGRVLEKPRRRHFVGLWGGKRGGISFSGGGATREEEQIRKRYGNSITTRRGGERWEILISC